MAVATHPLPTPPGVVSDARAQVDCLAEMLWAARPSEELVATVEVIESVRSLLAAIEAEVLTELDGRETARKELGWGSTADWFTHLAGLRRGQGKRAVDHARQLTGERPATLAALRDGRISPEQAGVVCDSVEELPGAPALRAEAEALLLDEAGRLHATDLAKIGHHIAAVVDPERIERELEKKLDRDERAAHLRRFLSITDDGAGGVRLRGRGTAEDAATLRAALSALTAPVPAVDPETCAELKDPRDHGARQWDALVEIAQQALSSEVLPESHGARPRVTVTTDLETLRGRLAETGTTDDGLELPADTVRRLACDADLIPVALGSRGEVLDVGRAVRLVTAPLWRALVCRDQHCAFPSCTRPPVMSHAHHIVPWAQGGPTSLDNLVMLCGHHHRLVHDSPWEVRLSPVDHRPEFLPPPRPGTRRDWIRSRPRRE